jgi:hypothetical protein
MPSISFGPLFKVEQESKALFWIRIIPIPIIRAYCPNPNTSSAFRIDCGYFPFMLQD